HSTSPSFKTPRPPASTTATAPQWRLSTSVPRTTSTRAGLPIVNARPTFCRGTLPQFSREPFILDSHASPSPQTLPFTPDDPRADDSRAVSAADRGTRRALCLSGWTDQLARRRLV